MILIKPYRAARAVEYARRWALSRNPLFYDFSELGGDCTDFASQCLLAGSFSMDFTKDFGWFYLSPEQRAPAWTGVDAFYDFLTGKFTSQNGGVGPFGREVARGLVQPGDLIQYANGEGAFVHTLLVSKVTNREIYVCAHSADSLDRPLSTYEKATAFRYLHVLGVRVDTQDTQRFRYLLSGGNL